MHAVAGLLAEHGGNITESQQFGDALTGLFFMRVQVTSTATCADLELALAELAALFAMTWTLDVAGRPIRTLILGSTAAHCLNDLAFRQRSENLPIETVAVVSNHTVLADLARFYDIPFHHIPVTAATKAQAEAKLLEIVTAERAELVVLARYMQVLSDDLCRALEGRAINIHHSFLPSFKGARPYFQAHERGVKIIGATAHYVTAELDEGPIIEQDIARVDHSNDPQELTAIGRDVESAVLARAVTWHAQRRVLVNGHKTVVFR